MPTCNICDDKDFKNQQGLAGHNRIVHPEGQVHRASSAQEPAQPDTEFREFVVRSLDAIDERLTALAEAQPIPQETIDEEALALKLAGRVVAILDNRHPPRFCDDGDCETCTDGKNKVRGEMLSEIEDRVPGTRERLEHWELMHTIIEIVL